jgi:uncharacterized membrane protein YbaN (DUF454 family)
MNVSNETPKVRGGLTRVALVAGGLLSVGVGSVGIIVPGLPTTVFFLMAAWCFARSSPRLEQWVLGLPGIGQLVADVRAGLGMRRRVKATAIAMMWAAIALSLAAVWGRSWLFVLIMVLGVIGTLYISYRVPTRERVEGVRSIDPGS